MADRPVFIPKKDYVDIEMISFKWHPGFAVSQKKRNIKSLHTTANKELGLKTILEVSTKSDIEVGTQLSAFNLNLKVNNMISSVESVYQGSKKFKDGGPYQDLYERDSFSAKKDERLIKSGDIISFQIENEEWPLSPVKGFYSDVYLKALFENRISVFDKIKNYQGFTDIEFNPKKSINCQAFCVACFIVLMNQNRLGDVLRDKKDFLKTISEMENNDGIKSLNI